MRQLFTRGLCKYSAFVSELRSCVKIETAVLGSPSLTVRNYGLCGRKATLTKLRSCVKFEVAVLGYSSLIILMVSVDEKQH